MVLDQPQKSWESVQNSNTEIKYFPLLQKPRIQVRAARLICKAHFELSFRA